MSSQDVRRDLNNTLKARVPLGASPLFYRVRFHGTLIGLRITADLICALMRYGDYYQEIGPDRYHTYVDQIIAEHRARIMANDAHNRLACDLRSHTAHLDDAMAAREEVMQTMRLVT